MTTDASKLVGMTRGARKRAALWAAFVPWCEDAYTHTPVDCPTERRHAHGCLRSSAPLRRMYEKERTRWGLHGRRPGPIRITLSVTGADEFRAAIEHAQIAISDVERLHKAAQLRMWLSFLNGKFLACVIPVDVAHALDLPVDVELVARPVNLPDHFGQGEALRIGWNGFEWTAEELRRLTSGREPSDGN